MLHYRVKLKRHAHILYQILRKPCIQYSRNEILSWYINNLRLFEFNPPRHKLDLLSKAHDGKRRSDTLPRWSQFVALLTGHLGERKSLRDITMSLESQSSRHYHLDEKGA